MALAIVNNRVDESISMEIPMGLKRRSGRPSKAVKGALNHQKIPKIELDGFSSKKLGKYMSIY